LLQGQTDGEEGQPLQAGELWVLPEERGQVQARGQGQAQAQEGQGQSERAAQAPVEDEMQRLVEGEVRQVEAQRELEQQGPGHRARQHFGLEPARPGIRGVEGEGHYSTQHLGRVLGSGLGLRLLVVVFIT